MAFTIKVQPPSASLTIGDDYQKTNSIAFTISLQGDERVWLTLQIPLGESGVLREPEDANDVAVLVDKKAMPRGDGNDPKEWWLVDADKGLEIAPTKPTELAVSINNILCRAAAGESQLNIIAIGASTDAPPKQLRITKAKPTPSPQQDQNPILYFIAEPTYLIGEGNVTLRWEVVGDAEPTLETPREKGKRAQSPTIDRPSASWTYYLRVGSKERHVPVNVLSAGWHTLKPFGDAKAFPSVIFDSGDRTSDALYAIFVIPRTNGSGRKAVLCKSKDGITGWEVINENVPEGMESSPGVRLKNRLWLIGGSAVDPARITNRIAYYPLDGSSRRSWKEASVTEDSPHSGRRFQDCARMGHACVIVDDSTVWMLGGMDRYHSALNDVWSLTIDGNGTLKASPVTATKSFTARCMFSAATFPDNMIWVCGGVSSPHGNPVSDLWTTPLPATPARGSSGIAWNPRFKSEKDSERREYIVEDAIGTGAASCTGKLNVVSTKRRGGPAWQTSPDMRSIDSDGMRQTSDTWHSEGTPAFSEMPSAWTSTPHSIAVVSFARRVYLRYLHRNALYGDTVKCPLFVRVY